jgi:Domain of unknown function (DUF397)
VYLRPDGCAGLSRSDAPLVGERLDQQQPAPGLALRDPRLGQPHGTGVLEERYGPTAIRVRDSKRDPATAPTLTLSPAAWQAFLGLVQS